MEIIIEPIIRQAAPGLKVVTIEADVDNSPTPQALIDELQAAAEKIKSTYELSMINKRPAVAATRKAYKALGKEPNRYRPSSEALCRRIVKDMGLYYINSLVDLINVVSIASGYSIGGFDVDKISGDTLTLGAGREGEDFEGIGRGALNIASMPVYRDMTGGVGTPTSDNERTKLDLTTKRLLMCINIYGEEMPAEETVELSKSLLKKYCNATNLLVKIYE
ncbi:phenylalanine--tRNA ligase beta subunit-related protein [uncultured Muribaculum sp.]|uniref:B3/B4 domain-containing protein n=1 Tax=uncultured Muribaculum sp. TaxID=1918613 RepID=UPI002591EE5F|nr:phenylalanine--tRNA ligase beta subunit-related protein [uncultured Muribaculum sp.]